MLLRSGVGGRSIAAGWRRWSTSGSARPSPSSPRHQGREVREPLSRVWVRSHEAKAECALICRKRHSGETEQSQTATMAISHFTAKVISRSKGRSAVAAAAYRSASQLHDYRQDLTFDYAAKSDVIHSEILAPREAPEWVHDRELLWNGVEAAEKRRDSQVAREVEFALPEELTKSEAIALARDLV